MGEKKKSLYSREKEGGGGGEETLQIHPNDPFPLSMELNKLHPLSEPETEWKIHASSFLLLELAAFWNENREYVSATEERGKQLPGDILLLGVLIALCKKVGLGKNVYKWLLW